MIRDSFAPEWLSPQQVAQLTGTCYRTVLRHIRSGRLPASQLVENGNYHVKVTDYDRWSQGLAPVRGGRRSA